MNQEKLNIRMLQDNGFSNEIDFNAKIGERKVRDIGACLMCETLKGSIYRDEEMIYLCESCYDDTISTEDDEGGRKDWKTGEYLW